MKKRVNVKRAISEIALFVSAFLLVALMFHSCQKDEEVTKPGATVNTEEVGGRNGLIDVLYPQVPVAVETDFGITFYSSCGRIMLEKGYIEVGETGEDGITLINKVYAGLTCDTENLLWEAVGEDVFENCGMTTITENLADPGTYVYRAKLNFKAKINSDCADCEGFVGNQFGDCFMVTVEAGSENEGTFTDSRDYREYKWVKIGDQVWMAQNLAYDMDASGGSKAYADVGTYGRWYNWEAAMGACPAGWHLPTNDEWNTLMDNLIADGYGYEGSGDDIAKALASKSGWQESNTVGSPGNDPESNNSSFFNAVPAGVGYPVYLDFFGSQASWWTATPDPNQNMRSGTRNIYYYSTTEFADWDFQNIYHSVRCVKDTE